MSFFLISKSIKYYTFQLTWNCPCRQSMTPKISVQILYFWKRYPIWGTESTFVDCSQYLATGSYEDSMFTSRTPRAQHAHFAFLVEIIQNTPSIHSRIGPFLELRTILVPRDPYDNSEMSVRARSLQTVITGLLTQTGF